MHTHLSISPPLLRPPPAPPRFKPGDHVVLAGPQPLICVVLAAPVRGLIRLSQAACPELRLVASVADVRPLAGWLLSGC